MAILNLLRRMERPDVTAHGFCSTFRNRCVETTAYPAELAEAVRAVANRAAVAPRTAA